MAGRPSLQLYLVIGFAVSSLSPLFLSTVALPGSLYAGDGSQPLLVLLLGTALFLPQLAIWCSFSKKMGSAGGLYGFTEAAVGKTVARVQALLWSISYLLYLPFTIAYVVYWLLPTMFNIGPGTLAGLEVILPLCIIVPMFLHRKLPFFILFFAALLQAAVIVVFSAAVAGHPALFQQGQTGPASLGPLATNLSGVSLLFVCGSLVLFLGGEVPNAKRVIPIVLLSSFAFSVAFILAGAHAMIAAGNAAQPARIAQEAAGLPFSVLLSITLIISILGLVVAEFIALSRLFTYALGLSVGRSYAYISAFFLGACLVSLVNPLVFYNITIVISISALYASFVIVFLAYPFFARKFRMLSYYKIALAAVAVAVFLYGLYSVLAYPASYAI